MQDQTQFYQKHLNQVSRSFALCIAKLETPLKAWVGLTYLICRILDTVEDSYWEIAHQQLSKFEGFDRFLLSRPTDEEIQAWSADFPQDIKAGELQLIQDSKTIFHDLHEAPPGVRAIIQQLVSSMSLGMKHFLKRKESNRMTLKTMPEVNQYCFFVAGVVGEALAKLVDLVEPKFKLVRSRIKDAHHFGLFLQKVNLLKDQLGDENEGRFLVPSRQDVLTSLKDNAEGAIRFLEAVPLAQREFRLFCAWSLFLGFESLLFSEAAFAKKNVEKVPKHLAQQLFNQIEMIIDQPQQLRLLFEQGLSRLQLCRGEIEKPKLLPGWLLDSYQGELKSEDFIDLGMGA